MRFFLHQIKLIEQTDADTTIISLLFKFILITGIALLVFFLTAQTYTPASFNDNKRSLPEMLKTNPPAPY
ncbi:hypothetical protein [Christiangramia forsetii]|uniref:Uncharacterized protein n=1 Tax=Christiangramia forsetii (strain DSM 17595 / CGMCC 1.15422 / KT0803) TaxID=411154 RepID=A0M703_CHRFK|nr:hypothetical protein [Christiangramia forsetii]CAL68398.1 hypothetical protein GFO_3459 [Christiangramia forsetii KT0803]